MSEILGNLMEILYKRGYVEYHSSLYANVLKEYNLEVPGLRQFWGEKGCYLDNFSSESGKNMICGR